MELEIRKGLLLKFSEVADLTDVQKKKIAKVVEEKFGRWCDEKDAKGIDIEEFDINILKKLAEFAVSDHVKGINGVWKTQNQINSYFRVKENPTGAKVTDLQPLVLAAEEYICQTENHYLFKADNDGYFLPYLVTEIRYHPPSGRGENYYPPHTDISLSSCKRYENNSDKIHFSQYDLKNGGKNIKDLLYDKGYVLESSKLLEQYYSELEKFKKESELTGKQFTGRGFGSEEGGRYFSYGRISLEREGKSIKLVMDNFKNYNEDSITRKYSLVHNKLKFIIPEGSKKKQEDYAELYPPIHPYCRVFDLEKHNFLTVHINNLEEYIYDESLKEKLILPEDHKNLIDILIQGASDLMEDIIKGKTGGIIILATGEPGTGKTLTAEVYSEIIKKPLYVVQSSQLGIDLNEIEKKLKTVLDRSVRWNAILLIDESDVYIHERGADLTQNAVVGIFLRVLEYYRGILFLTSNRGGIIDDAILSRATAHINYTYPTKIDALKIFEVLRKQFQIEDNYFEEGRVGKVFGEFIEEFKISGRDIKNILKLSKLISIKQNKKIDCSLMKYCAGFLNVSKRKDFED